MANNSKFFQILFSVISSFVLVTGVSAQTEWPYFGGDAGGMRYSTLNQINRENVKDLEIAWKFHTGGLDPKVNTAIQCTPIVIDGVMYLTGPDRSVFALDAATGRKLWEFNANFYRDRGLRTRGVAYWSDGRRNGARRILFVIPEGRLYSIDARTGLPDPKFGRNGIVELREGTDPVPPDKRFGSSSPVVIFENLAIMGFSVSEGYDSVPNGIRAYDVRTGREVWHFRTIPLPGEVGHESWLNEGWKNRGGANAWGGVRIDPRNGIVFAGLGSAAHDFYGGDRPGDNLFANCVIALDARTGKRIWHFQTTRHDLWDYDIPAPPTLITVNHNGRRVEALVQGTKTGHLWVLDRKTGKPLFGYVEREAPKSDVPGEWTAAKQVYPVLPPPLVRQEFTEKDITDVSPESRAYVKEKIEKMRLGPIYTPPSLNGTVQMPGLHGGATWSGTAFDPETGWAYVNVNDMPWTNFVKPSNRPGLYNGDKIGIFKDQFGLPASKPPWGYLVAVDLNKGQIKWKKPFGNWPGAEKFGLKDSGTENFGGAMVTAGGLVFIGSTMDEMFHVFDKKTGEKIREYKLPAAAYAAPMTYSVNGRQYVVIACGGGGKAGSPTADVYVAFALPETQKN